MTNWHNEIFIEEGWYDIDEEKVNEEDKADHGPGTYCRLCGTRTGLHSFSFGKDGTYR